MTRIRLAIVVSTLDVGGAENVMFDVVTRLSPDRFECRLFFLREPGTVGGRILERGVSGAQGFERWRRDPLVPFRLVPSIRAFSPHIAFMLDHHNAILWGNLSARLAGVKASVVASHSTGRMGGAMSFNHIDRWMLKLTSRVIALSDTHARYLSEREGVDGDQIVVIENGIDIARYRASEDGSLRSAIGADPSDRIVTMVAALRPEKAHEALFDAAASLVVSNRGIKFLIVGDGERRSHLEARCRQLGLEDHVIFVGERDDVPALLAISDALVLPSHGAVETLPLAVLEAMAAGVPVVASAVGSIPEVIRDRESGLLIGPADANGLGRAIRDILEDNALTAKLVANARETVQERYTVDRMVGRYETLFESLAD